jgi:aspartate kinase
MDTLSVLKFGGASVAHPSDFAKVAQIIKHKLSKTQTIVVVISAMAKTTDELIAMAHKVSKTPSKRELDMLISVGERISIALLAMALQELGVEAVSLTGSQSGIITTHDHFEAKIIHVKPKRVQTLLAQNKVVIVAGFQGVSELGEITTLGRGGSDTSAVGLAVALGAKEVEFFKDVQGVYDQDPAVYPEAQFFPALSYEDMIALCLKGAKILHARSVQLAKKNGLKLIVRSFIDPTLPYTTISDPVELFKKEPIFE